MIAAEQSRTCARSATSCPIASSASSEPTSTERKPDVASFSLLVSPSPRERSTTKAAARFSTLAATRVPFQRAA